MRLWSLILFLLLAGCATSTYISGANLENLRILEPGKATKADALALAGQPLMRAPGQDGTETWTYVRSEARGFAVILPFYAYSEAKPHQQIAVLTFKGDVLERLEYKQPGLP